MSQAERIRLSSYALIALIASVPALAPAADLSDSSTWPAPRIPTAEECDALRARAASGAYISVIQNLCGPAAPLVPPSPPAEVPAERQVIVGPNLLVNTADSPAPVHGPETQSEPYIAVRSVDGLRCSAFNDFQHDPNVCPAIVPRTITGYSFDAGAGWVHPGLVPIGPPNTLEGDPVVTVGADGNFHLAHLSNAASLIAVSTSSDCNAWPAHVNASSPLGPPPNPGDVDKPWIAADVRAGAPPAGNLYVCWTDFSGGVAVIRATTGPPGGPFAPSIIVGVPAPGRTVNGCQVAVNQLSGRVYHAWWDFINAPGFPGSQIMWSDCAPGLAACTPQAIAVPAIAPIGVVVAGCAPANARNLTYAGGGRSIRVTEFPALAVNQITGHAYLTWNDNSLGNPDIFFAAWAPAALPPAPPIAGPIPVNVAPGAAAPGAAGTNEQFMPAIAWRPLPLPLGGIKITYYDHIGGGLTQLWDAFAQARLAHAGPASWLNQAVSAAFGIPVTNPNFDACAANCYMGDYNGIASDPAVFHMVWGDNRLPDPHPNPEGNVVDPNVFYATQTFVPRDHYLCYGAKDRTPPPGTDPGVVNLIDQFQHAAYDVRSTRRFCTPADKNGEGVADDVTHLKSYKIKRVAGEHLQPTVAIENQFGTLQLHIRKESELMVPSSKDLSLPPPPPDPARPGFEHFKCYAVKVIGPKLPPGIIVEASDQFGFSKFVLRKPTKLCNPVSKNGSEIKDPTQHLVCYGVRALVAAPVPIDVKANNQFGDEIVRLKRLKEICVPSLKFVIG